jgi:hypothetical protein
MTSNKYNLHNVKQVMQRQKRLHVEVRGVLEALLDWIGRRRYVGLHRLEHKRIGHASWQLLA